MVMHGAVVASTIWIWKLRLLIPASAVDLHDQS